MTESDHGAAPPERASLGILFVHGIGDQRHGETLVGYVDPLAEVLRRLITEEDAKERARVREIRELISNRPKRGPERQIADRRRQQLANQVIPLRDPVVLRNVSLSARSDRAGAEVTLDVDCVELAHVLDETRGAELTTWHLKESWWAEQFLPPDTKTLAVWALYESPQIAMEHFVKFFRRIQYTKSVPHKIWRIIITPVLAAGTVVLAGVVLAVLLTLLLLSLVPIPKLSAAVKSLSARLTLSIGDSFVLSESPTQYSAMVSRVAEDLDALSAKCDRVAIIAHSQGAMIAHECLRRQRSEKVHLLVTVGSGLGKLSNLRYARNRSSRIEKFILGTYCLSFPLTLVWWLVSASKGWALYALCLLTLSVVFKCVTDARQGGRDDRRRREELRLDDPHLRWVDVFSSADPVPNGPIFERRPSWLARSWILWNSSSVLSDHVSYRKNLDGFVFPLLVELGECEGGELGSYLRRHAERANIGANRRAWRAHCLVAARIAVLPPIVIALTIQWVTLQRYAEEIKQAAPAWVSRISAWLGNGFDVVLGPIPVSTDTVISLLVAAGVTGLAYAALVGAWSIWNKHDIIQLFAGDAPDAGGIGAYTFFGTTFLLFVAAVATVVEGLVGFDLIEFAGLVFTFTVATLIVAIWIMLLTVHRQVRRLPQSERDQLENRLLGRLLCAWVGLMLSINATMVAFLGMWGNFLEALLLATGIGVVLALCLALFVEVLDRRWTSVRHKIIAASLCAGQPPWAFPAFESGREE